MKEDTIFLINLILITACIFVFGFIIGTGIGQKLPVEPIKTKVDTLVIYDTITQIEPISVEKRVVESVLVPVVDSVMVHDTLFVLLDREQVVWQDSLSTIYASGINPQVDSVKHFIQDRYITIETQVPVKVRSKWGLGVQAGMGACKDGLTPYVGIGLSYNLLSW